MIKSTCANSKAITTTNNSKHSSPIHISNEEIEEEKTEVPILPSGQAIKAQKEKEGNCEEKQKSTNFKENETTNEESNFLPKVNIYESNEDILFESLGFHLSELNEPQKQSIRRGVELIKLKKKELNDTNDFIDTRFFKLSNGLYIPVIELFPDQPYNYYLTDREFMKKNPRFFNERLERDLLLKGDMNFIYEN